MDSIKYFLDWLIPRFVTDHVALEYDKENDRFVMFCHVDELEKLEDCDAFAIVKGFNFFGYSLFSNIRAIQVVNKNLVEMFKEGVDIEIELM
jgi:hypothetical protein